MASRCKAGIERSVTTDFGRGRESAATAATGNAAVASATMAIANESLRAFIAETPLCAIACGQQDEIGDLLRFGNEGDVTGVDFDRPGFHSIGKETLQFRRGRLVLLRDRIEGRFGFPRSNRGSGGEER